MSVFEQLQIVFHGFILTKQGSQPVANLQERRQVSQMQKLQLRRHLTDEIPIIQRNWDGLVAKFQRLHTNLLILRQLGTKKRTTCSYVSSIFV
jgi:hypothetical protein